MNQQGNLNTFLDISVGSGTHAPRQRQAFASKRLQQVISDFRKAQKSAPLTAPSRSASVAAQGESGGSGSGSEEEKRPKKRKRKQSPIASGSKAKAGSRPGVLASRGRGRAKVKRKAQDVSSRKSTSPDLGTSGEDETFIPAAVDAVADRDILHEFTLRPRPKPKPRQKIRADARPSTTPMEETLDEPEEGA